MSLRPAQALVAESSKFNLRTLFETKAAAEPAIMPLPLPLAPPGQVAATASSAGAAPASSPPLPPLSTLPKIATKEHNKFTFNGLVMPSSAQNASSPTGVGGGLSASAVSAATASGNLETVASENLRLKAATHTLQDKVAQLTQHLATTSESVMRGNKALVAERAQFHAQYATLQDKLKEAQAALIEAEAAPREAVKNEKLLTAKLLELQAENDRLGAAADDSKLRADLDAAVAKHTSLAAQHSVLLEKHLALTAEHEQVRTMLEASQAETSAALAKIDALKLEAAAADALVDTLDAKLADARTTTVPTDGCGCSGGDVPAQPQPAQEKNEEEEEEEEKKEVDAPVQPPTFKPTPEAVQEQLEQLFGPSTDAVATSASVAANDGAADTTTSAPWTIAEREAEAATATEAAPPVAASCPKTMRCEELQKVASEARHLAATCCERDTEAAKSWHAHCEAVAKRAWASLASGKAEAAIAVHIHTDPLHTDEAPIALAADIPPVALQKGAKYEGRGLLQCEVPCGTAAVEYPNTPEGRTNAFIEAVSRDMKVSMDGSQEAYAHSAKTGTAVRV